ncbi:MAG: hypothetical protein IJ480_09630 [Clostridia bacterium]|nr:hypothetical protein [Clostridia bacterium]
MKTKRIFAMLLAALMLSSVAACGETEPAAETAETAASETAAGETETQPADSIEARKLVEDGLPEKDFGGAEFVIQTTDSNNGWLYMEELTGDVVDDAIYNRNSTVSERFNVELVFQNDGAYNDAAVTMKNTVLASEDLYDLVCNGNIEMGLYVAENIYLDFNLVPYVDFTQPWWSKYVLTDMAYKGVIFMALGSLDMSHYANLACMYYNRDLAAEYGLEDIYSIVEEGRWTFDKFKETITGIYQDVNGDGTKDDGDRYGYSFEVKGGCDSWLWYSGKKICTARGDGTYEDTYYDEKVVSLYEYLYDLAWVDQNVYCLNEWNVPQQMFAKGNTLIAEVGLNYWSWVRDSEIEYAIIPGPKWDESQENYASIVVGGECQVVLRTAQDLEMIGIITEALNAESWKSVMPAYYDVALKFKGARDEQTIAILDLIIDNLVLDFGTAYGGWASTGGGAGSWIHRVLRDGSADIASYYAGRKSGWELWMADIYAGFEEYIDTAET